MEALKTSDGAFTPALLLAVGLLVFSTLLIQKMKDPTMSGSRLEGSAPSARSV
jgi:hypothetical protein